MMMNVSMYHRKVRVEMITVIELINLICGIFIITWTMLSISTIKNDVKGIRKILESEERNDKE